MENTLGGGGVRTSVRNCDLLGEFIRWGRWMYGRGGEGRVWSLCGWKKLERGRRGYCRGWVLLLPTVNMLEVDNCFRDKRQGFRWAM